MSDTAIRQTASYDHIIALPEHVVGEIVDGELVVQPRPALHHANASGSLRELLGGPFRSGIGGPGGWWLLPEPELHLGADVVVPDLAGWRKTRMPRIPNAPWSDLAPDWVCEVLSPGSIHHDRVTKSAIYCRHAVGWFWIVDVRQRTIEAHELAQGRWSLIGTFGGNEAARIPPFDAVGLDLGAIWQVDEDGT